MLYSKQKSHKQKKNYLNMANQTYNSVLLEIRDRLSGHTAVLSNIQADINEINAHLEKSNGRLGKLEVDVINIKHEEKIIDSHIDGIKHNCKAIQDAKIEMAKELVAAQHNRIVRYTKIVGTFASVIAVCIALITFINNSNRQRVIKETKQDINLINEKVDSIIMRNGRVIKDISPEYY